MLIKERFENQSIFDAISEKFPSNSTGIFLRTHKDVINGMYMNRSSQKNASPLATTLTDEQLSELVVAMYEPKWTNLFEILMVDILEEDVYSPYHISKTSNEKTESSTTIEDDVEEDSTNIFEKTKTDDRNGSTSQIGKGTNDNTSNVYGFNSEVPVPTDDNNTIATNDITTTVEDGNISTENYTDTNDVTKKRTSTEIGDNTVSGSETISGNIGNLTRDDISKTRIRLLDNNFIRIILVDVDEIFAEKYYGGF